MGGDSVGVSTGSSRSLWSALGSTDAYANSGSVRVQTQSPVPQIFPNATGTGDARRERTVTEMESSRGALRFSSDTAADAGAVARAQRGEQDDTGDAVVRRRVVSFGASNGDTATSDVASGRHLLGTRWNLPDLTPISHIGVGNSGASTAVAASVSVAPRTVAAHADTERTDIKEWYDWGSSDSGNESGEDYAVVLPCFFFFFFFFTGDGEDSLGELDSLDELELESDSLSLELDSESLDELDSSSLLLDEVEAFLFFFFFLLLAFAFLFFWSFFLRVFWASSSCLRARRTADLSPFRRAPVISIVCICISTSCGINNLTSCLDSCSLAFAAFCWLYFFSAFFSALRIPGDFGLPLGVIPRPPPRPRPLPRPRPPPRPALNCFPVCIFCFLPFAIDAGGAIFS